MYRCVADRAEYRKHDWTQESVRLPSFPSGLSECVSVGVEVVCDAEADRSVEFEAAGERGGDGESVRGWRLHPVPQTRSGASECPAQKVDLVYQL